jgi:hypothetical protein
MMENKGPVIIATVVPLTVISTVFAGARLFVKGRMLRRMQLDDGVLAASVVRSNFQLVMDLLSTLTITVAVCTVFHASCTIAIVVSKQTKHETTDSLSTPHPQVSSWISTATAIAAVRMGHGRHQTQLTTAQKEQIVHWTAAGFAFGIMSFALPKLVAVSLIGRVLNPNRLHRVFLWLLVGLCCVALFGNIIGLFAQCVPKDEVRGDGDHVSILSTACLGPNRAVRYSVSTSGGFPACPASIYLGRTCRSRGSISRRRHVFLVAMWLLIRYEQLYRRSPTCI